MKTDDLLRLADALDGLHLKVDQFDMYTWAREEPGCGFAGCAIGWGARLGVLPPGLYITTGGAGESGYPARGASIGVDAIAEAYDIEDRAACELFFADRYADPYDPKLVAERIRLFVAGAA